MTVTISFIRTNIRRSETVTFLITMLCIGLGDMSVVYQAIQPGFVAFCPPIFANKIIKKRDRKNLLAETATPPRIVVFVVKQAACI
ncbi:hypothetical protein J6590_070661 [Homalodisca vitripennis]|nr:hypothetical protein J6590_070661 [Homalodisca vitripennis]